MRLCGPFANEPLTGGLGHQRSYLLSGELIALRQ